MDMKFVLLCFIGITFASGGEICCESGCYNNDDPPFDGMPLPLCPEDLDVTCTVYTRTTRDKPQVFSRKNITSLALNINPSKKTVLIGHGWTGSDENWWMVDSMNLLLDLFDYNIVLLDWSYGASYYYYPKAAANARTAGVELAAIMEELVKSEHITLDNVWCIGFSLGSHVFGHAGMLLGGKIARITGLDPAGPWFKEEPLEVGLNPTSAKFVDVMHSDGEGLTFFTHYGQIRPLGHSDFYPNKGYRQPGCITKKKRSIEELPTDGPLSWTLGCSHYRSIYYFIETLKDTKCHVARHVCADEKDLPDSCIETDESLQVGLYADQNKVFGKFYFETEGDSAYCKY